MDSKFWNNVYETKAEDAVSWYQETPKHSLETILSLNGNPSVSSSKSSS